MTVYIYAVIIMAIVAVICGFVACLFETENEPDDDFYKGDDDRHGADSND